MNILIHSYSESRNFFIQDFQNLLSFADKVIIDLTTFWDDERLELFDIIVFQWPEEFFQWKVPSKELLERALERLSLLANSKRLIAVRHNILPHAPEMAKKFESIYMKFYSHMDGVIHFGEFSRKEFLERYSFIDQIHVVIPHPNYESLIPFCKGNDLIKVKRRKRHIVVIGQLRNEWERNTLFWIALKNLGKYRFSANNSFYARRPSLRTPLSFLLWFVRRLFYKLGLIGFLHPRMSAEKLSEVVIDSDGILILRKNALNSGNVALAITFERTVIVPNIGNLKEMALSLGLPVYNPDSIKSLQRALDELSSYKIDYSKVLSNLEISRVLRDFFSNIHFSS